MKICIDKDLKATMHKKVRFSTHLKFTLFIFICIGAVFSYSYLGALSQGIERITVNSSGEQADASSFHLNFSDDANIAAFQTFAHNFSTTDPTTFKQDVIIRNHVAGESVQITRGNDDSFDPSVSADGRYVAFISYADNLVPNDTNTTSIWIRDGLDVFLYDRAVGQLDRVSLNENGEQINGNSVGVISPDGASIVFLSNGKNVVNGDPNGSQKPALYIRNWQTGAIERLTYGIESPIAYPNGSMGDISMSKNGRFIVFDGEVSNLVPNDTNDMLDVFILDRNSGQIKRVSEALGGGNANGLSSKPRISANGEIVVFHSEASNLVPNDTNGVTDIFVYTIATGDVERISVSTSGAQGNGLSREPAVCENGRFVVFTTEANNLVAGDTNNQRDVLVRDRWLNETYLISKNDSGTIGNGKAHRAYISNDCKVAGFASDANNLVANDTNSSRDLFRTNLLWADFVAPIVHVSGEKAAGEELTFTYQIRNVGTGSGTADFSVTLPNDLTLTPSSITGGATESGGVISWSGTVSADSVKTIIFKATVNAGLTDFANITLPASVEAIGQTLSANIALPVNGLETFLPFLADE